MQLDDSTSVLNALQAQLGPETIQKMSLQLGTDTAATSNAISMALPILLGGLSKNAANAEGAAALDNALTAHHGGILAVGDLSRILDSNHDGQIADDVARIGSAVFGRCSARVPARNIPRLGSGRETERS